jgi:hypothetical protein
MRSPQYAVNKTTALDAPKLAIRSSLRQQRNVYRTGYGIKSIEPLSVSVGKSISLCTLCGTLCLCGEIAGENLHHKGTEIAQRTTEINFPTDFFGGERESEHFAPKGAPMKKTEAHVL